MKTQLNDAIKELQSKSEKTSEENALLNALLVHRAIVE